MRRSPPLVAIVALVALTAGLAGCVKPDPPEAPAAEPDADADAALTSAAASPPPTGTVLLLVRMPDLTPLAGAKVSVANLTAVSSSDGRARVEGVPAGRHQVEVKKEAHRTAELAVDVPAGGVVETEAVLPLAEGAQHSHERGLIAHRDVYAFAGHFDCSATYVIITGDCLILIENVTSQTGAPVDPSTQTTEKNVIDFPLDLTWTSLIVEMAWTTGLDSPATGERMTLALEPAEAPTDGHAAKYARVAGASPLRVELRAGETHPSATADDMPNPLGGEVIRARAFVAGMMHNPGGTTFLGVGAAKDHEFTLYVSIFYGETPPEGYTAIGA